MDESSQPAAKLSAVTWVTLRRDILTGWGRLPTASEGLVRCLNEHRITLWVIGESTLLLLKECGHKVKMEKRYKYVGRGYYVGSGFERLGAEKCRYFQIPLVLF
jgi:hypothetical protein